MKKKLIKKYQSGGSPRQYNYQPLPPKDKWNGVTSIKDLEGNELSPGDLVMATPEGKMVTPDNTQAYLDYMAANDIPIQGPTLNQITVTHNNQTGKTTTSLGEDFEDRLKRLQQDPIANDSQLKQLWLEQGEQLWNQSHDKHVIDTRAADKAANAKTPEALSIMSPALVGIAAILGFESATAMAAWAAAYPEAFTGIVGSTLGGEIINLATNLGSGGKYRDWGDAANQIWGTGETLGGFTNPGYFVNPLLKTAPAIKQFGKAALDKTVAQLNGPWADRTLNTANKYNLGESVKAGIYNLDRAQPYIKNTSQEIINDIKDAWWLLKKSFNYPYFDTSSSLIYRQKYIRPSQRKQHDQLTKIWKSAFDYTLEQPLPKFKGILKAPSKIQERNSIIGTPISIPIQIQGSQFRFLYPADKVRKWFSGMVWPTFSNEELGDLVASINKGAFDKEIFSPFTIGHIFEFNQGLSKLNIRPQPVSPKVNEINNLLGDLGHVTGSSITVKDPFTEHTPNDIDIITTAFNYPKVLELLNAREVKYENYHAKIVSPEYGKIDVQLIEPSFRNSRYSTGKIAQEIYAKLNPDDFSKRISDGNFDVPMDVNDLLKAHKDNVLKFSNIDMMLSGQPKHQQRLSGIYAIDDSKYARQFMDEYENTYRAYMGDQFQTIEDQGINIDFTNIENNIEFLNKFGLAEDDVKQIAKDPEKMRTFVYSFLYRSHMGVRSINVPLDATQSDILNAALTNGSVSNKGGNFAQRPFGGSGHPSTYGKSNPYLVIVQFPIKNKQNLKTPMDVYNYVGKLIDVTEPIKSDAPVTQQFRTNIIQDFQITQENVDRVKDLLHLPEQEYSNIGQILAFTVPNRNPNLQIAMDWGTGYIPEEAQKLYKINNEVAKTFGDHFWSLQSGFDYGFIAKYGKDVPGLRFRIIPQVQKGFNMGFQLPQLPLRFGVSKNVAAHNIFPYIKYDEVIGRARGNILNKQKNAQKIIDNMKGFSDSMITENQYLVQNLKRQINKIKAWTLPPLAIYGGVKAYNGLMDYSRLNNKASEIFSELPEDLDESLKVLKQKYNITLSDEQITKLKDQIKQNKTYSYHDFVNFIKEQLENQENE